MQLWLVIQCFSHLGKVFVVKEILERLLRDRPQSEQDVARGLLIPLLNIYITSYFLSYLK